MRKPVTSKSTAEKQFAAIQKKHKITLNEMESNQQKKAENIAIQRTLRLAKEAAEKQDEESSKSKNSAPVLKKS